MCGTPVFRHAAPNAPTPRPEQRTIFIDLRDLHLPGYLVQPDERATVASHIYERFTPFADDGWEWTILPSDAAFDGWVYENIDGRLSIVGANLVCRRPRERAPMWSDAAHHVSEHRVHQLTGFRWTAEPGSKVWRELPHEASSHA
jgi:hypothetical protein